MHLPDRHRFVLGLALVVGLALLGRWAMHHDDAADAPSRLGSPASIDSPSQRAQLPAIGEAVPDTAPSREHSVSAFGTLRGRVIDSVTLEPVREFEVQFHGTRATKVGDEAPGSRRFHTAEGRFEWQYLPPGDWRVTASAPGYQRFELDGLHIPRGATTQEIVLPLRPGHRLQGRIYDETSGVGIAAASVGFRESETGRFEGDWRSRPRVNSGEDGSFVLDGVPAGRVTLEISAQDYAGRELDVVVGNETASLEIGLSTGGTIAGRLTAADGITPVAGMVGLFHLDQGFGGRSGTGEAGEFSYRHLSAGRYQLTGQAAGGSVTREVVLASNQRIEGLVLALNSGHRIRGVVTGLRPADRERVSVSLYRDGVGGFPHAAVRVDDRGAYALHGVQPGRVHVIADVTTRRQISKTVEMPADSDITVDFDFPPGARLSGRVTRGGRPLAGVWLKPRPAVEHPVHNYGTSTSKDGMYALEDLPAGEYTVRVDNYRSRPVQVSGDTVFDIEVPLPQLSGRVLEGGGEVPVVGADVAIWSAEPDSSRIRLGDRTNHFGRFALAGLEPGDFMLTAYKSGYELLRMRLSYGSPVTGMTIRLRQEIGVEIRVRDATTGKPLPEIFAIEMIGDRNGSGLQLHLDDEGVGYIPSALAGSTLSFSAVGYVPTLISGWTGQRLELKLEQQEAR